MMMIRVGRRRAGGGRAGGRRGSRPVDKGGVCLGVQGDDYPAAVVAVEFVVLPDDGGGGSDGVVLASEGVGAPDDDVGVGSGRSAGWVVESGLGQSDGGGGASFVDV